jgi:hypothetical protein
VSPRLGWLTTTFSTSLPRRRTDHDCGVSLDAAPRGQGRALRIDEALGGPGLLMLAERFADEGWTQEQFSGWLRSQISLYGAEARP